MINIIFILPGNTPGATSPERYKPAIRRFAETYKAYPAGFGHKLWLVNSNGGLTEETAQFFSDIPHDVLIYRGSGWDIGAHQFAALTLPPEDWVMCFATTAHFRRKGWLRSFVEARDSYGDGLYGSTSCFAYSQHIRTNGFFIRCERMHRYPHGCNSRKECFDFELGPDLLSQWCIREGYGVWLVAPEATVPLVASRELSNVFKRGDQSNIWTYDNHTEAFDNASLKKKIMETRRSDGTKRRLIWPLRPLQKRLVERNI